MKRFLSIGGLFLVLCGFVWLGCGGDDEMGGTPEDDDSVTGVNNADIVGTWKLVSVEPLVVGVGDFPEQVLTIKDDGTWRSTTCAELPAMGKFTVVAEGTYQIDGDSITSETTSINTEPAFGLPLPINSGILGEATIERNENNLIIISSDETTGQTTVAAYEKQ